MGGAYSCLSANLLIQLKFDTSRHAPVAIEQQLYKIPPNMNLHIGDEVNDVETNRLIYRFLNTDNTAYVHTDSPPN